MPEPSPDLARLQRWVDAGGTWRVLDRSPDGIAIALCTCDSGEEADRLSSTDSDLIRYVVMHQDEEQSS